MTIDELMDSVLVQSMLELHADWIEKYPSAWGELLSALVQLEPNEVAHPRLSMAFIWDDAEKRIGVDRYYFMCYSNQMHNGTPPTYNDANGRGVQYEEAA